MKHSRKATSLVKLHHIRPIALWNDGLGKIHVTHPITALWLLSKMENVAMKRALKGLQLKIKLLSKSILALKMGSELSVRTHDKSTLTLIYNRHERRKVMELQSGRYMV